jgi:hypothetical protein
MRKNLSSGVYLGYNGISGAYRKHPEDKYQVWFDQPSTPWGNLRDESIKAARQLRDRDFASVFPQKSFFRFSPQQQLACLVVPTRQSRYQPRIVVATEPRRGNPVG